MFRALIRAYKAYSRDSLGYFKMAEHKVQETENFRHLVRVVNTDLDGSKPLYHALLKIRGVGPMFSNMICNLVGIDKNTKTGNLTDAQAQKLEAAITNPLSVNAPSWMLNRRNDYETGEDKHLVVSDIKFVQENDIKRMRMIKSYKGIRHGLKLPVRGQSTKSNFRKNKGKVMGVKKVKSGKSGK